jgi:tripartite-type tricarboxylate transporter receptor subunit TctC
MTNRDLSNRSYFKSILNWCEDILGRTPALCRQVSPTILLLLALVYSPLTLANRYPTKEVRLVVPFPSGGTSDLVARAIAAQLTQQIGSRVFIENRPGAAGSIGSSFVAKSAPDGYTILLSGFDLSASLALYPNLDHTPATELLPISQIGRSQYILIAGQNSPARTVQDLITIAKTANKPLDILTTGNGTISHLLTEYFGDLTGIKFHAVHHKGSASLLSSILTNKQGFAFVPAELAVKLIANGATFFRVLAVSSSSRSVIAPQVPTMAEAGVHGFDAEGWYGVFAPAGTPESIVIQLQSEILRTLEDPKVREALLKAGVQPAGTPADTFGNFFRSEVKKWSNVIKTADIRVPQPLAQDKPSAAASRVSRLTQGIAYTYFRDGSCTASEKIECLSDSEYAEVCREAKGVTRRAIDVKAISPSSSHIERTLLKGGTIEAIRVLWAESRSGFYACYAIVTVSGVVDGTAHREEVQGIVQEFVKSSRGEVLVNYFSLL